MAKLDWVARAALFNDVLGIIAHQTIGDPQRLISGHTLSEGDQAKHFVASGSAVLAGLLLELSDLGEDMEAAAAESPFCALFLASCPIDSFADAGLAYFRGPGGVAKLESLLDQFPNFRAFAVADVFDRSGRVLGRAPKLQ